MSKRRKRCYKCGCNLTSGNSQQLCRGGYRSYDFILIDYCNTCAEKKKKNK